MTGVSHDAWTLLQQPDPLAINVVLCTLLAIYSFLSGLVTGNVSVVDRQWSVVPIIYAWVVAWQSSQAHGQVDRRCGLVACLITLWGLRLTYNFWRKGGYKADGEDYRWAVLKAHMHPAIFQIFNLVFISCMQHCLLLAITLPTYQAYLTSAARKQGPPSLQMLDFFATGLFLLFFIGETIADQQQWAFQKAKQHSAVKNSRGFVTTGLFRYSRHPNFFCEQGIWLSVYLFCVAATKRWLNWSCGGGLALMCLFQGSTWLTELLSAERYPAYKQYQATTSRLLPWFPYKATGKEL